MLSLLIMKIISIFNNKGGVGKTTSAQNIGAGLAIFADQRILIIDADQQANLTLSFGIRLTNSQPNIANFILQDSTLEETRINYNKSNIDILPASPEIRKYNKQLDASRNFPFNLKQVLDKIHDKYDFVIIDCPPSISTFTQMALVASHKYYIPLQAEYFSYEGLRNFAIYIDELKQVAPNLELGGIFATRFNPKTNKKLNKEIIKSVRENLGNKILNTHIRENIALTAAQAKGMHIFEYDKQSNGAKDYHTLTKEIWETINR
jgi:chromosome partitioning protein